MTILVADDERSLVSLISRALEADGHRVFLAQDGAAALDLALTEPIDLIILDLSMPKLDGEDVLVRIRSAGFETPILILSARKELEARVRCLDLGADDCMNKPFSMLELRARSRALLRRRREIRLRLRVGDIELDRVDRIVSRNGKQIALTNKEFGLLEHLMLHRGHCVSRIELLEQVWKQDGTQTTNVVDVYINYLRRKLNDETSGGLISTVRGQGYCISANAALDPKLMQCLTAETRDDVADGVANTGNFEDSSAPNRTTESSRRI